MKDKPTLGRCAQVMRAVGIAAVMLAGCATAPPPPRATGPLPTAAQALTLLRRASGGRQSLRTAGRLTYYGDKGRVRVRAELVARRPNQFRVATISPFEQPIDVMTCNGTALWLLSQGVLRSGPATPTNVARLLPLPLEPTWIVDMLLGGVPSGGFEAESLQAGNPGQWVLALAQPGNDDRVVLTVDADRLVVAEAVVERPAGALFLTVVFDDFEALPKGGYYPQKIQMTVAGQEADVRLKLKSPEVDVPLHDALFSMEPPPGQPVQPL